MSRSLTYHNQEPTGVMSADMPKSAIKKEFARRLQQAMTEKGWNQSELADNAKKYIEDGVFGRYSVSCYVRGHTLPRPKHLHAMAKALGKKPGELLPTRGVPSADKTDPPLDLKDIGEGQVWLRVNQSCTWPVALEVMKLLKGK